MWASIDAYARRHRITGERFDRLLTLIRAMDHEYLRLLAKKANSVSRPG